MKVKVIASNPKDGQAGIRSLIGRTFEAKIDKESGDAEIFAVEFNGLIRLSRSEFKKLSSKPVLPSKYTK